jgi:MoaA/NifB/PqqE/SkfB family radical SAM enzyme
LDHYKLLYLIEKIHKQIPIKKISFTGGEPSLLLTSLLIVSKEIKEEIDPNIGLVLSTNGQFLHDERNAQLLLNKFDSISISCHHFDSEINESLMGCKSFKHSDLQKYVKNYSNKIHLSCNIIKNGIESVSNIDKYLNYFGNLGVNDFGFVGLMKGNDYCKNNYIDINSLDLTKLKNCIKTKTFNKSNICNCSNYLKYDDNGNILKLYIRQNNNPDCNENILVYDENFLKTGFDIHAKILY